MSDPVGLPRRRSPRRQQRVGGAQTRPTGCDGCDVFGRRRSRSSEIRATSRRRSRQRSRSQSSSRRPAGAGPGEACCLRRHRGAVRTGARWAFDRGRGHLRSDEGAGSPVVSAADAAGPGTNVRCRYWRASPLMPFLRRLPYPGGLRALAQHRGQAKGGQLASARLTSSRRWRRWTHRPAAARSAAAPGRFRRRVRITAAPPAAGEPPPWVRGGRRVIRRGPWAVPAGGVDRRAPGPCHPPVARAS